MLINVRRPISFEELRTVNGQVHATYHKACQELNLKNNKHWNISLADTSNTAQPQQTLYL